MWSNIFVIIYQQHGYQEIGTPQLVDKSLWESSGHWDNFGEEMFVTESEETSLCY